MKRKIVVTVVGLLLMVGMECPFANCTHNADFAAPAMFGNGKAYAAEVEGIYEKEIKMIYTTEPALAYTFYGLTNETVVMDVLTRLNRMGSKATFFISEVEMRRYPKLVQLIGKNGHEIGIAIRPLDGATLLQTRSQISSARNMLQSRFGVKTNMLKQPGGPITDTTLQAMLAEGCVMIGQSVNVVQSKHKDYQTAEQIASEIFPKAIRSYGRGQIVHFRMDFYTNNRLVGELMEIIKQRRIDNIAYETFYDNPENNPSNDSRYKLKPVGALLNNKKYVYRYPVALQEVPAKLRKDGPAFDLEKSGSVNHISHRYIGNKAVTDGDRILNFSKMETRRFDKSGLIHTNEKVIFLTFDDWGSDAALNKLMYVLRKHNVTGAFFIITRTVLNNPNLLRALAAEGHEIASHSDEHKPMSFRDLKTGKLVASQSNKAEYVQELIASFGKLRDVVGNVTVNGHPSLTRFLRPPQLALSKLGLEAAFEAGYDFIVNGSFSSRDYDAKDAAELVSRIRNGIFTDKGEVIKGAILVMHMSDAAPLTPVALDLLLTANAAKADTDPSKFKVGRLSDYLIEPESVIKLTNFKESQG